MIKRFDIYENGIYLVLEASEEGFMKLLHFSALPFREEDIKAPNTEDGFRLVEMNLSGYDRPGERHGNKYIYTAPGYRMKYESHKDYRNELGRKLEFTLYDEETQVYVTNHMQFYDGISVVRCHNVVENRGEEMQTLEMISSFNYTGIEKEGLLPRDAKMSLRIPHNSWQREMNWRTYTLPELGMCQAQPTEIQRSSSAIEVTNTGNWSAKKYLPMGYLENTETGSNLFWQIEHNGSWHWEIADQNGHMYLCITGPNELQSHWSKNLYHNDVFETVPVAVGVSKSNSGELQNPAAGGSGDMRVAAGTESGCRQTGFDAAMGELTKYRRMIRRKNDDNESLKIIFNDYMNCLWADPTTEKELPLIDAAAEAGCEYFCIDAGWYAPGLWWDAVGEWKESRERFPNGMKEVTDYIRSKGMIPGVWLEIEVMGIHSPVAEGRRDADGRMITPPIAKDDWFFMRHGKRVYDRSRYQLDFRNPEVIVYVNGVMDRIISEYGVGYIKMDYNIEPGIGTELDADSVGDGMLGHERAYIAWLKDIFAKYPNLIIENCSSGGLRIDYAMLSQYSIQSTSDQEWYGRYATIAANAPAALTPEQAAIWSYPLRELAPDGAVGNAARTSNDREEVVFNMVNAMLLRIHQSGHLAELSAERKALVKEALDYYKTIRQEIKTALPFWPIGLSKYEDEWVALGLRSSNTNKIYLAVWRREGGNQECVLPIPYVKRTVAATGSETSNSVAADIASDGTAVQVKCVYPSYGGCEYLWNIASKQLTVKFPRENMARLFEITY